MSELQRASSQDDDAWSEGPLPIMQLQGEKVMRFRALIWLTLFVTTTAAVSVFAQERIARLKITDIEDNQSYTRIFSNEVVFKSLYAPTETDTEKVTFFVYTVAQIDSMRAENHENQMKVAELLESKLILLRKNLKDLSDMNDALVKRLDELDERVAAGK